MTIDTALNATTNRGELAITGQSPMAMGKALAATNHPRRTSRDCRHENAPPEERAAIRTPTRPQRPPQSQTRRIQPSRCTARFSAAT